MTCKHTYPKVYDTAIPYLWVRTRAAMIKDPELKKLNPTGHIVWSYDDDNLFGQAYACCELGERYLNA